MKQEIRPATLRTLRERRGLSQASLADRSAEMRQSVGIATIKRIETCKDETCSVSRSVAEKLAKVLGVDVKALAREPEIDDIDRARELRNSGMRQLRANVPEQTSLAFRMVEHIYGVPIRTQIEMAPLFMAILAEGSLAWRSKRLAEIDDKVGHLMSLAGGHLSFTNAAYRVEEAGFQEAQSIRKRDVFGKDLSEDTYEFGYDPNTNNPFADYLRSLAGELEGAAFSLDPDGKEIGFFGFPEYKVGTEILDEITAGDTEAEYALACGHAKVSEIPQELLGAENTEARVEWLISRIPDDEAADRKARREELLSMFGDLDLSDSADVAGEKDDA